MSYSSEFTYEWIAEHKCIVILKTMSYEVAGQTPAHFPGENSLVKNGYFQGVEVLISILSEGDGDCLSSLYPPLAVVGGFASIHSRPLSRRLSRELSAWYTREVRFPSSHSNSNRNAPYEFT